MSRPWSSTRIPRHPVPNCMSTESLRDCPDRLVPPARKVSGSRRGVALPQDFPHLGFGVDADHQLGNQAVKAGVRPVGQGAQVVPDQPLTRDDSGKVLEQLEIAPFRHRPGRVALGDHEWVRTGWAAGSAGRPAWIRAGSSQVSRSPTPSMLRSAGGYWARISGSRA